MRYEMRHREELTEIVLGGGGRPPEAVYTAVVSLVDPADVRTSFVDYVRGEETTTWRLWLLTYTAIAYIELRFDVPSYDEDEEEDLARQRRIPATEVVAMWVRPLSEINEFAVTDMGPVRNSGIETRVWFPVGANITFNDGHAVALPAQSKLHQPADRARSDEFTTAVRAALTGAQ